MISISILPFGFLMQLEIGEESVPVALCNDLTADEAYRLSVFLSSVGNILAKGNIQIRLEESIVHRIEESVKEQFAIDPRHLN
jgi:hypothetical protein